MCCQPCPWPLCLIIVEKTMVYVLFMLILRPPCFAVPLPISETCLYPSLSATWAYSSQQIPWHLPSYTFLYRDMVLSITMINNRHPYYQAVRKCVVVQ